MTTRAKIVCTLMGCVMSVVTVGAVRAADSQAGGAALLSTPLLRYAGLEPNWQINLPIKQGERVAEIHYFAPYVYVLTSGNYLVCIDPEQAALRFATQLARPGLPLRRVFFYEGQLYFMAGNRLLIVSPQAGSIAESKHLNMIGPSSVFGVVRNADYLYVSGSDRRLHAVVPDEYWQAFSVTSEDDSLITSVVADEAWVIFATASGHVVSIAPDSRQRNWQFDILGRISAQMKREGQTIYVASEDTKLYKLDVQSGGQLWSQPFLAGASLTEAPIIGNELVYQYAGRKGLYGIDKETGRQIWNLPEGVDLISERDGRAYVFAEPGRLVVMDNRTGERLYSVNMAPVDVVGTNLEAPILYVADYEGRVMSIDVTEQR